MALCTITSSAAASSTLVLPSPPVTPKLAKALRSTRNSECPSGTPPWPPAWTVRFGENHQASWHQCIAGIRRAKPNEKFPPSHQLSPSTDDNLPRSRLLVNGLPTSHPPRSTQTPSTPTFILTGPPSRVKPCAQRRTASRLRGLTPAALPVFLLPCLRSRSMPPTYPSLPHPPPPQQPNPFPPLDANTTTATSSAQ
jgi:hypothetical protein